MHALRHYQESSIEQLRQHIRAGVKRIVLQLPTGGGKTLVACSMTHSARERGKRVLFLADRIELIDQASLRFDQAGIDHGIIQGDHWRNRGYEKVQIATIQTLQNRKLEYDFDVIFVDECHAGGKRLNDWLAQQECPCIGLSATPWTPGMGKTWQELVVVTDVPTLIKEGFLVMPEVYAPSEPNLEGVKTVAGEYDEEDLAARCDLPVLIGDIVQTWALRAADRQTICFACNVAHSKHIVEQFVAAGINAVHIDGYMEMSDRRPIVEAFRKGEIKVISNVGILDKGFDVPEAACLIYARPIKSSLALYVQMGGRVLRPAPGKTNAIILDHSGNTLRHGFLTDPMPNELDDGKLKKKTKKKQEEKGKKCPKCAYVKAPGVHECPSCGFKPAVVNEVYHEAGELEKVTKTEDKRQLYAELRWIQEHNRYSSGWTAHKYKEFVGVWPGQGFKRIKPVVPSDWVARRVKFLMIKWAKARQMERDGARV